MDDNIDCLIPAAQVTILSVQSAGVTFLSSLHNFILNHTIDKQLFVVTFVMYFGINSMDIYVFIGC